MILVDAVYINQSGGKVLLVYLISSIKKLGNINNYFFLLDDRLESNVLDSLDPTNYTKVSPSETNRRLFYKKLDPKIKTIFCFANIPPTRKIVNRSVFILIHNALLLKDNKQLPIKQRLLFYLKRSYIKLNNSHKYKWIVQTQNMSNLLCQNLNIKKASVLTLPFYEANRYGGVNQKLMSNNKNFLYVADGVPQKNHSNLLLAWEQIFDQYNLPLALHLTIPIGFTTLINEIGRLKDKGLQIFNHGVCNAEEIKDLYTSCNYLVFPSLTESFGLPLIEAAEAGCEIIASNLNYVYDVVTPYSTFNPFDINDMAKKIVAAYHQKVPGKTELLVEDGIHKLIRLLN